MRYSGSTARHRSAVLTLALVLALLAGACGRDVTRRDVTAARAQTRPAVPTTAYVPTTTTMSIDEPAEHWTATGLCDRDGTTRRGGATITAIWDRSFALGCGALIDSATGTRFGWAAAEDLVTLANGAVVGRRTIAKSPTFAGGREYVLVNAAGRVVGPYGVLPDEIAGRSRTSWLPSTEQGVFVGLWNEAWLDERRASGASGLAGSGADLVVYDSRVDELRVVDPSARFRTTPSDLAQWWVVNGQVLLAGRNIGVLAVNPADLSVRWTRTPAELGGALVGDSLDFGRTGTVSLTTFGSSSARGNLDVRTGAVDRTSTTNALVRGAVQVPLKSQFAVYGPTQIFVNNGFAAAVRNGAQLWAYPGTKGPCDFAELPVAGAVGLVMACGGLVVYQRA